mgnify:CR=1
MYEYVYYINDTNRVYTMDSDTSPTPNISI